MIFSLVVMGLLKNFSRLLLVLIIEVMKCCFSIGFSISLRMVGVMGMLFFFMMKFRMLKVSIRMMLKIELVMVKVLMM